MELKLSRRWYTDESTIGSLTIDAAPECYVLEDVRRPDGEKVYGKTCIPPGRYKVEITRSPRFQRELPLLIDVPGFQGVRIHPGNTSADTEGCLLPGRFRADNRVGDSGKAFAALFNKISSATDRRDEIWITIEDGEQWTKAA